MAESFVEYNFIHHEMLVHPAIFTHQQAAHIAIIGNPHAGVAAEVLKHATVKTVWQICPTEPASKTLDPRLQYFVGSAADWRKQCPSQSLDIIILPETTTAISPELYKEYFNLLRDDGILIQQGESFFIPEDLKTIQQTLQKAGFYDIQVLHFPQPSSWQAATMASKAKTFKQVREKDIFNKPFATRYYNFDVHKAALVIPEFMRHALTI